MATTDIIVAASGGDHTTIRAAYESAACIAATAAGDRVVIRVKPGTYTASNFGLLDGDVNAGGTAAAPIYIVADKQNGSYANIIISTTSYAFNITKGVGYVIIEGFDCTSSTPGTIGVGGGCVNLSSTVNTTNGKPQNHIRLEGLNAYNYYDTAQLNHGFLVNGLDIELIGCRAWNNGQHGCYIANADRPKVYGGNFSHNGGRSSAAVTSAGCGIRYEGDDLHVRDTIMDWNASDGFAQYVDSGYTARRLRMDGRLSMCNNGRHGRFLQNTGAGEKPLGLLIDDRFTTISDNGRDTTNFNSSTHVLTPMNDKKDDSYVIRPFNGW